MPARGARALTAAYERQDPVARPRRRRTARSGRATGLEPLTSSREGHTTHELRQRQKESLNSAANGRGKAVRIRITVFLVFAASVTLAPTRTNSPKPVLPKTPHYR